MTCYLFEPGVEFEISTFLWIFSKISQNSKKWKKKKKKKKKKKTLLDNFILFLKINESHAVQEKLDGYHGYWCISKKNRIILQKSVATIGFI